MLVKICGLTLEEDARFAARCGADFLGIVLAQTSPRRATEKQARAILALKLKQPIYLVFGYDDADYIRHTFAALAQTGTRLQIMADHPQIGDLLKLAPTELIMPSISAAQKIVATELVKWEEHPLILFDSHRGNQAGGTGKTFDHNNIAGIKRQYLLAGGLNPDNVAAVITQVNPPGVDTASGVEASPGIKDHSKVRLFLESCGRRPK